MRILPRAGTRNRRSKAGTTASKTPQVTNLRTPARPAPSRKKQQKLPCRQLRLLAALSLRAPKMSVAVFGATGLTGRVHASMLERGVPRARSARPGGCSRRRSTGEPRQNDQLTSTRAAHERRGCRESVWGGDSRVYIRRRKVGPHARTAPAVRSSTSSELNPGGRRSRRKNMMSTDGGDAAVDGTGASSSAMMNAASCVKSPIWARPPSSSRKNNQARVVVTWIGAGGSRPSALRLSSNARVKVCPRRHRRHHPLLAGVINVTEEGSSPGPRRRIHRALEGSTVAADYGIIEAPQQISARTRKAGVLGQGPIPCSRDAVRVSEASAARRGCRTFPRRTALAARVRVCAD